MISKLNNFMYKINEPLYTTENIEKVKQASKEYYKANKEHIIPKKNNIEKIIKI